MPNERRRAANHSKSSGGSSPSTTTVTSCFQVAASQKPPHSQAPRWGRARMGPIPLSTAFSIRWKPSKDMPASSSSDDVPGSRKDSTQ